MGHSKGEDVSHAGILDELLSGEELSVSELSRRAIGHRCSQSNAEQAHCATLIANEELRLVKQIASVAELKAGDRSL